LALSHIYAYATVSHLVDASFERTFLIGNARINAKVSWGVVRAVGTGKRPAQP